MPILILQPNGDITTKLTLEAARTDADVSGKTVLVTSNLTEAQSNISGSWPVDRSLELCKGGVVNQSTGFTINGPLYMTGGHFGGVGTVTANYADTNEYSTMNIKGSSESCTGNAASATTALDAIGIGQSWQNMTSSRVQGTTYTNTTDKPIQVSFVFAGGSDSAFSVNGQVIAGSATGLAGATQVGAIVPPLHTYKWWGTGATLQTWCELR